MFECMDLGGQTVDPQAGLSSLSNYFQAHNTARRCQLILIESKSAPRSGHHFLKKILENRYKENFSYCEKYHEVGCCGLSPCNAEPYWCYAIDKKRFHLRMVKSHDFQLEDEPWELFPGAIRLVQVRDPLACLISWLELDQFAVNQDMLNAHGINISRLSLYHEPALVETASKFIDLYGRVMSAQEAAVCIEEKSEYLIRFIRKWLPTCQPLDGMPRRQGTYLLRYEVIASKVRCLTSLDGQRLPLFYNQPRFRVKQDVFRRRSFLMSKLFALSRIRLFDASRLICDQTQEWVDILKYSY